jgi:hypothetical protein
MSTKAYDNANKNPLAHMVDVKMSFEQAATESKTNPCFLGNEEFKKYLKISDCSQVQSRQRTITPANHYLRSFRFASTYLLTPHSFRRCLTAAPRLSSAVRKA